MRISDWSSDVCSSDLFQLLDPVKTLKMRVDFLLQLHDREALLPREQQRRFLATEGWVAWSGPAVTELLKQFIVTNRMMTGGFVIKDQLDRTEGRRGGKEGVSTGRYRGWTYQ